MRVLIQSIVLAVFVTVSLGAAPPPSPAGGATSGGGGMTGYSGGMGSDPLRFKGLVKEGIREKLAAGDEEWKGLWPKIEKVMEAQRNARTGAGMSFSSERMVRGTLPPAAIAGGGPAPRGQTGGGSSGGSSSASGGAANVDTPAGRAMQQIRASLEQAAGDAELLEKVAAMRAARDASRADLVAAQKELHDACSLRQEAVLLTLGLLD